jgi:hypothetical protein
MTKPLLAEALKTWSDYPSKNAHAKALASTTGFHRNTWYKHLTKLEQNIKVPTREGEGITNAVYRELAKECGLKLKQRRG